jgi:hypothetical protein
MSWELKAREKCSFEVHMAALRAVNWIKPVCYIQTSTQETYGWGNKSTQNPLFTFPVCEAVSVKKCSIENVIMLVDGGIKVNT